MELFKPMGPKWLQNVGLVFFLVLPIVAIGLSYGALDWRGWMGAVIMVILSWSLVAINLMYRFKNRD